MILVQRPYKPGDEVSINRLYKLLTGRKRSFNQYRWEWLDTWNGQGSIWLAFDEERKNGDQLIMQYSLIPTPLSVYGESFLAGKTENCMAHPDCRGKGIYFFHEQKYFEEAKKRFQIFFTTTGNVANGAPGAVRRKLGYRAFDSWINLYFLIDTKKSVQATRQGNMTGIRGDTAKGRRENVKTFYCSLFVPPQSATSMHIVDEERAPLKDIDRLWDENKGFYGITVERSLPYLDWRINKNPYFHHQYLLYRKSGLLKGYIIFYKHKKTSVRVVDIFAENKDIKIFRKMIKQLTVWAKKNQIEKIFCTTNQNNQFLRWAFYSCGFLSSIDIRKIAGLKNNENLSYKRPFHVFVSKPVLKQHASAYKARNWYMTELVFEGREN